MKGHVSPAALTSLFPSSPIYPRPREYPSQSSKRFAPWQPRQTQQEDQALEAVLTHVLGMDPFALSDRLFCYRSSFTR